MIEASGPWIATPHLRPDYRGPVDRPYVPFHDPAVSRPMIELLEGVANRSPGAIAVESPGACLSYRAFWQAVCRLQNELSAHSEPGDPIAILLPPGAAYVVAVFAVLASRRIGLLLDHGSPGDRNTTMVATTGVKLVLATPDSNRARAWPGVAVLSVTDAFNDAIAADPPAHEPLALDEPAFILCTSGSTGLPKPIVHSQRTMLHWVRTNVDTMHLAPDDRVLSISSPSTLAGCASLITGPLTGASLQMLQMMEAGFGGLLEVLATRPVTILRAAPSLLRALARVPGASSAAARLRLVHVYGEPLLKADLAELRKSLPGDCLVRFTYGSTEASGFSWFAGEPDDFDPVRSATGILMPDTEALIVDDDGRACAPGEAGELLIRSRYNALGEWKGGKVERGMFEPAGPDAQLRAYRTGDIARFHPDGVFVVLGRKDRMVKVNGQRVEPAEVEVALRRSSEVLEAEVLPAAHPGATRLIAFVVAGPDAEPDLAERLDAGLRAVLPGYMVPSRIHILSAMPRLPGGKVDGQQLLSMARKTGVEPE
jgi:acyl-coenzyme A synthetase/AMP-(fatty) acid ligase